MPEKCSNLSKRIHLPVENLAPILFLSDRIDEFGINSDQKIGSVQNVRLAEPFDSNDWFNKYNLSALFIYPSDFRLKNTITWTYNWCVKDNSTIQQQKKITPPTKINTSGHREHTKLVENT